MPSEQEINHRRAKLKADLDKKWDDVNTIARNAKVIESNGNRFIEVRDIEQYVSAAIGAALHCNGKALDDLASRILEPLHRQLSKRQAGCEK